MKTKSRVRIFSVMRSEFRAEGLRIPPLRLAQGRDDKQKGEAYQPGSECPFLREAEARQRNAIRRFGDLHLHDGRVGRGDLGGPQYRVLREYFAVHLGDKVILAGCVLAPDLSEFDALHCHKFFL